MRRAVDDDGGGASFEHREPDRLLGLEHEGPVEEHVRRDRRQHHRPQVRRDDRAPADRL